jgi:Ca2+-binding RTX toxin-like protein
MVKLIRSDLEFILDQIKISEQLEAGVPVETLIPHHSLRYGLRTVDGSDNNLLHPEFGAADNAFPRLVPRTVVNDADGDTFDNNGPAPGGLVTNNTYIPIGTPTPGVNGGHSGNVADADPRIISNLIVDMTIRNKSAVITALEVAGSADPEADYATLIAANMTQAEADANLLLRQSEFATADAELTTAASNYTPGDPVELDALLLAAENFSLAEAALAAAVAAQANPSQYFLDTATSLGLTIDNNTIVIPNTAPDEGLSAPFNSWMTLFGQFFDHGLDLITKGGNGTVYIPLQPDDPLITLGRDGIAGTGDEITNPALQFMPLTRATPNADGEHVNTTTPWVDQNQTYTSHPSHQVFLREYELNASNDPVSTGRMLDSATGGIGSWLDVKTQAANLLGIELVDIDVFNVPMLLTDPYGRFIPGPNGFPQIVYSDPDGIPNSGDELTVEGNPADPVSLFDVHGDGTNVQALRTGHAFLDDIAHNAVPGTVFDHDGNPGTPPILVQEDADTIAGNSIPVDSQGRKTAYDDELLDAHKVTGDGRGNENVGLTAVHHIFHSEHNRQIDQIKAEILASGDAAFIDEWQLAPGVWDGERLFQAARFATEMQYQHLVFEEFARKVQPLVNVFGPYNAEIDPSIFAEFAHAVYRFGHSMLTETVARMNPDGTTNDIGLIEAFLNPIEFDRPGGALADVPADVAAGAIIRGMTRQSGNEIDEFVTEALRNNLVGLPLDLATINLARARDTGAPTLQEARTQFFAATGDAELKPYVSWTDFALHAKHQLSVINFIAAYGQHAAVTSATTLSAKRDAATLLVLGDGDDSDGVTINGITYTDRHDFLNSTGTWTAANSGLNSIDLWIGGLAEAQNPFGGLLGSTFNFVFETQLENLQDSDRFYYLGRLAGTNFLAELEGNSFAAMVIRNTDLADYGMHLPADIFSNPTWILEVDQSVQVTGLDANGDPVTSGVGRGDPVDPSTFEDLVVRDNPATAGPDTNYLKYTGGDHVVLGGSDVADVLIAGIGDDSLWGDEGDDTMEGGAGVDALLGGDGDDLITDENGDDNIKGQAGDDAINAGDGFDLVLGGDGNDFIMGGADASESFGGNDNDFINAGDDADTVFGDAGHDWIEGGLGQDLLQGDFGAPFQDSETVGNDIIIGGAGDDDYDSESGDDIMFADDGIERNEGMLGFDWVTYKLDTRAADADLAFTGLLPPDRDAIRDRFDLVEGLSGWNFNDILRGDNSNAATLSAIDAFSGQNNAINNVDQVNLITNLDDILDGATSFNGGNIILGGGGSDLMEGRGGNDILDGDAMLDAYINVHANLDGTGAVIARAEGMTSPVSSTNPLLDGKSLTELMFTRVLNPGQLQIQREIILNSGGASTDTDTAVFSDIRANYTVSAPDPEGWITVTHLNAGIDGVDRIRGIERLQFADQTQIIDTVAPINGLPIGNATITGSTAIGSTLTASVALVTDPDNINPPANPTGAITGPVTFFWQQQTAPGVFTNLLDPLTGNPVTGPSLVLTADLATLILRVRATYNDDDGVPEQVFSGPTAPVGFNNTPPSGIPNGVLGPVDEDVAFTVDESTLLLGIVDPDIVNGDVLNVVGLAADNGTVVDNLDGTFTITPNQDFNGLMTLEYDVEDSFGGALLDRTQTYTVDPVNDAPTAAGVGAIDPTARIPVAQEDELDLVVITAADLLAHVSDVEGDALVISGVTAVNRFGQPVTVVDNGDQTWSVQLLPNDDTELTFSYTVTEQSTAEQHAITTTAVMDILPVPDEPVFVSGATGAINENDAGVAYDANAIDPDNDPATQTLIYSLTGLGADDARFTINALNGTVRFATPADFETPLDAGADNVYDIQVAVTDGDTTVTQDVAITVNNVVGLVINGTDGVNNLTGTNEEDTINGLGGNDVLRGQAGADSIDGGAGNDILIGGIGADTLDGGAGTADSANYTTSTAAVQVDLSLAVQVSTGDANGDVLIGIEAITGSNVLSGDTLTGNGSGNTLIGMAGADTLNGAGGNDLLFGGTGNDSITGGAGVDSFFFQAGWGNDRVSDFQDGVERINVAQVAGLTAASFGVRLTVGDDGTGRALITDTLLGNTIVIENLAPGQITAADFVFAVA